jgi:hypothetical protein
VDPAVAATQAVAVATAAAVDPTSASSQAVAAPPAPPVPAYAAPQPAEVVAAPPGAAAAAAVAAVATAPGAQDPAAGPPAPDAAKQAKVKVAADETGAMLTVTKDLESDKARLAWAESGGTLPGFEGNVGVTFLYKDLSEQAGKGAYMNGTGVSAGGRLTILSLEPPKYETRDTSWTAYKIGVGMDVGQMSVTINLPTYRVMGVTYGGPETASMATRNLTLTLGLMQAKGSFDSPTEWSGYAFGVEWAPSRQTTVLKDSTGHTTTTTTTNPRGFAISLESGSLQSMASKMGKKARLKFSLFALPPTGDLPLLLTMSVGAIWY